MILRYIEIETNRLFNWLDPMNITCWNNVPEWRTTWWDDNTIEKRMQFGKAWTKEFDKITGHFSKLRESIDKEGVKFPVNTATGLPRDMYLADFKEKTHFPPDVINNTDKQIYVHTFGGSRVTIALELGIETVPCIVHDFIDLFHNAEQVTQLNFRQWFGNDYIFTSQSPHVRLAKHCHLTDAKFSGMNNHTREAQLHAAQLAREQVYV